ncbi:MAG: sel1 repeat family protein [Pseudomonadota bacterium]|nr:sel1 repeat family protein [Pseudomonadota bacterium]
MNFKNSFFAIAMLVASVGSAFAVDLSSAQAAYDKGDYESAFKQFLSLAEEGNALAQSSTGVMYDMGHGAAKDYDKAVEWYSKSAEQGNQFGQFNLGTMYYMGTGVTKDVLTACKWFALATRQGNGQARIHMHICEKYLSEAQMVEFNRQADEFAAQHKN